MKTRSVIIAILAALAFSNCDKISGIEGEGPLVTETLSIDEFTGIELDGSMDVFIEQGNEQLVEVEGHANIIDRLKRQVSGGVWLIDLENGNYRNLRLKIFITTPGLRSVRNTASGDIQIESMEVDDLDLEVDGSGDIFVTDFLTIESTLDLQSDGSGDIEIEDLKTSSLDLFMDASGDVYLAGTGESADIEIDGSGDLKAFPMTFGDMEIRSSASGMAEIMVEEFLKARLSGSGDIKYRGFPDVDVRETGSGRLLERN